MFGVVKSRLQNVLAHNSIYMQELMCNVDQPVVYQHAHVVTVLHLHLCVCTLAYCVTGCHPSPTNCCGSQSLQPFPDCCIAMCNESAQCVVQCSLAGNLMDVCNTQKQKSNVSL